MRIRSPALAHCASLALLVLMAGLAACAAAPEKECLAGECLKTYCTPPGGYVEGRRGSAYHGVCSGAAEKGFLEAFRHGQEVGTLLREVQDMRQKVDELEVAAMSGEYSDPDRTQMRFRADDMNQRLRVRQWDLERLDRRYCAQFGAPELNWMELRQ